MGEAWLIKYSLNSQSPFGNQRLNVKATMKFVVTENQVAFKTHPNQDLDLAAAAFGCKEIILGTEKSSQTPDSLSGPWVVLCLECCC